jgi:hypothetical protein
VAGVVVGVVVSVGDVVVSVGGVVEPVGGLAVEHVVVVGLKC